jgi:hypothetical protein
MKISRETRALFNPENTKNRFALNENYNIQLPLIEKRGSVKVKKLLIQKSFQFKYTFNKIKLKLRCKLI